jgi:hypothetical protein
VGFLLLVVVALVAPFLLGWFGHPLLGLAIPAACLVWALADSAGSTPAILAAVTWALGSSIGWLRGRAAAP